MNDPRLPCRNCGGEGTVMDYYQRSEGYVETVVDRCGLCGGSGYELADLVTCEECDGTGTAPGTFGELTCNHCDGKGEVLQYSF